MRIAEYKQVSARAEQRVIHHDTLWDDNGNIVFKGEQVCLGGNDRYVAMCRKCWLKKKAEQEAKGLYL